MVVISRAHEISVEKLKNIGYDVYIKDVIDQNRLHQIRLNLIVIKIINNPNPCAKSQIKIYYGLGIIDKNQKLSLIVVNLNIVIKKILRLGLEYDKTNLDPTYKYNYFLFKKSPCIILTF